MNRLFATLDYELKSNLEFTRKRFAQTGEETIKRTFITEDGNCPDCSHSIQDAVNQFTFYQLELPDPEENKSTVSLNTLLTNHDTGNLVEGFKCVCNKNSVLTKETFSISKFPYYLLIQLMRYKWTGRSSVKIRTMVSLGAETTINDIPFELIGTVDHKGSSTNGGHYILFNLFDSDK